MRRRPAPVVAGKRGVVYVPGMHPAGRRRWTRWSRRATSLVALLLQVVLLTGPVAEFRDASAIASAAAATDGDAVSGTHLVAPGRHAPVAHNEATCPACIARSLHARLEFLNPLPVPAATRRDATHPASARTPAAELATSHLSRAPPAAG